MPADTDHRGALTAGTRLREFELLGPILGHGGFGITYLARDTVLDTRVAIKEYVPSAIAVRERDQSVHPKSTADAEEYRRGLQGFLEEAQKLARFHHPNIVGVRRFFEAHGTACIVMEYIDGPTLADVYRKEGTLPESRLRNILTHLLAGLEEVHRAGFLHRDVKPMNIMLRRDDVPVLLDFGSARADLARRTGSLTAILTPGYAPIEQYYSGGHQGPWTDIYAVGAVIYRGMTRVVPLEALARLEDDRLQPAAQVASGDYSRALLQAVDWALKVQSSERPSNIAEWRAALQRPRPGAAGQNQLIPAESPNKPARQVEKALGKAGLSGPIALVAAGLACAAIAGGAWWLSRTPIPVQTPEPIPAQTPEPIPAQTPEPPSACPPDNNLFDAAREALEDGLLLEGVEKYLEFEQRFPDCSRSMLARLRMNKMEEAYWHIVQAENTIEAFRRYLAAYPNGRFREEAEQGMAP